MNFQQTLTSTNGEQRAIRDFEPGLRVNGAFCVRDSELRQKRNGEPFLKMTLGDRSGTMEAISWDDANALFAVAKPGSIVIATGVFEVSERFGAKLKLETLRTAEAGEFEAKDLTAASDVPLERLQSDLRQLLDTIQNGDLQLLLEAFFGEGTSEWERFRDAPAAKHYHQAYMHGLLEHTVSVAQAVSAAAAFFPGIDRDVAVTGALLHDIGKTLAYNDDPMAIDMTDLGRLHGEIPLGYYKVRRAIEDIQGFDSAIAQSVLHIILSHHGTLEHGSPVVPATREAALVHAMDNIGGKLGSFDRIERELPEGQVWSRFDRALDGSAFFSRRAA